jgi:hypothetical protein
MKELSRNAWVAASQAEAANRDGPPPLQLHRRARRRGAGAIEEESHAKCFCALNGYEPHLPANMVNVVQPVQLCFVLIGVAFQTRDALLNGAAKPWTDLESILGRALHSHREHLGTGMPEAENHSARGLKVFLLLPILSKHPTLRQITASRNLGNVLSGNETVVGLSCAVSAAKPNPFLRTGNFPLPLQQLTPDHRQP